MQNKQRKGKACRYKGRDQAKHIDANTDKARHADTKARHVNTKACRDNAAQDISACGICSAKLNNNMKSLTFYAPNFK